MLSSLYFRETYKEIVYHVESEVKELYKVKGHSWSLGVDWEGFQLYSNDKYYQSNQSLICFSNPKQKVICLGLYTSHIMASIVIQSFLA